jgi:hypothetical protein
MKNRLNTKHCWERIQIKILIDGIGGGGKNRNMIMVYEFHRFEMIQFFIIYLEEKAISITKIEEYHHDGFSFYLEDVSTIYCQIRIIYYF